MSFSDSAAPVPEGVSGHPQTDLSDASTRKNGGAGAGMAVRLVKGRLRAWEAGTGQLLIQHTRDTRKASAPALLLPFTHPKGRRLST